MKIIFLEFDGVLNSDCYYLKRNRNMRELRLFEIRQETKEDWLVQWHLYNLDLDNIDILKEIVDETGAEIVVISNWKTLSCFKGLCRELIKKGLPIIDVTKGENKEEGINDYLLNNEVESYVILDNDKLHNYDSELLKHLVITKLNGSGLREKEASQAKRLLMARR